MRKSFLIVAGASLFLAAVAQAQKKNAPFVRSDSSFSSDSRLVLIDSIVTDKKGAYIGDLSQKDFKVREDGKEQAITSFSYVADESTGGQKPYVVLLFDNSTVPRTYLHYAQDAAMTFIGGNAGPGRLMAIAEFEIGLRITQNLTDDVSRLRQAVSGVKSSNSSANTGFVIGPSGVRAGSDSANSLQGALRNLAKGLARFPGRKAIVLFSEGLSVSPDAMKGAIEECNTANAAVYAVDIGALTTKGAGGTSMGDTSLSRPPGMNPTLPLTTRQSATTDLGAPRPPSEALHGLAEGTGGFVVSSAGNLREEMNRIGAEQRQYYVLGYLPSKESAPGACHTIKVNVDRGGASVRARTSYCDERTPELVTGTSSERDLEARLNANATSTAPATMQAPFFYVAPNTARVDLALDIPGAGVKFAKDKGKFVATLNVIGIAYLPDNGVAARFGDTRKVTLDDQKQVDDFAAQPYHYEKQFEMPSGTFDLKVAFSSGAAGFGQVEMPLTIEPWEPSKFTLSALALCQMARPVSSPGLGGELDLFGDNVALTANGMQFAPAGTNRLRKQEKAFIYGEIYAPALAAGAGLQLTVLNAKTGESVKRMGLTDLKPETVPGTAAVPFGISLPTEELAPGSYIAEIAVQDAKGSHAVRRIDFELAP